MFPSPAQIQTDFRALARAISLVENNCEGYRNFLQSLSFNAKVPVIGITGPPGAGKSTLCNGLLSQLVSQGKKVALIAVDPSSPFNFGALLGDRIRLNNLYNHPNVYIRSLASRGSLGGLSSKIIEVTDVVRAANFEYIFVETVGVGQSEVEIAGVADTSLVVLVPESGDEIQTMKAGLMEIADIFVVNKADRADAEKFVRNLKHLVHEKPVSNWSIPVLKAIATKEEGLEEILEALRNHFELPADNFRKSYLLASKALKLIQSKRMESIRPKTLQETIALQLQNNDDFNLYRFVEAYS